MDYPQFLEEARQLARPCVHLRPDENGSVAAIWGGSGLVEPAEAPALSTGVFRHWFSVDCRFLPVGYEDVRGCLSAYIEEDAWREGDPMPDDPWTPGQPWPQEKTIVAADETMQLPDDVMEGTKLYAHSALSWPPVDAVFRFGSPAIAAWNPIQSWDGPIVGAYMDHLRKCNPLFEEMKGVWARLGGWHDAHQDGDWEELLAKRLIAVTYRDAEPWLEIWVDDARHFEIFERIT